jgi:hypothetical protein
VVPVKSVTASVERKYWKLSGNMRKEASEKEKRRS